MTLGLLTRDPVKTAAYVVLAGMASHIGLQVATVITPEIPFSKPFERTRRASTVFLAIFAIGGMGALLPPLIRVVRVNAVAMAAVFAIAIGTTVALNRLIRLRVERQAAQLELDG